ncbi:DNA polymerase/3'-5' exonuclease PolX [Candidatus Saganbacteria bacterium]|nr:DNA polymerase/3'-5' exonuclease PolX [Candidatus Saganbacteria bacterium]
MENSEIARIFWQIAELLELKGENPFKIRAYQKVARNLEGLSQNLEEIYKKGGLAALEEVPGIGEAIASHIVELLKTGKVKKYRELLEEFPPSFIELMEVPGLGPKTALLLKKKFKIDSIKKLEKATAQGLLKNLPGFKEKKIENIRKGLELKKKVAGRYLLSEAGEFAEALISQIKKIKGVDKILPCGSLRRQKETIGDLDILVTSNRPQAVLDAFVKLPQVARILGEGPTKSSVILKNNLQADLRVLDPENFGAAAHYFTGSKLHNIAIRELAIKKGLKISEYGVFRGKKRIGGKTEEEVFKAVGLPYIPPELREGRGEIEAARAGKLPDLIELQDIRGDLQMHSKYSDGGNSIEEMAEAARKLGYQYIAVTDHTLSTRVAGGQTEKEFLKELEYIDKLNDRLKGFRVLKGVEVDILPDGTLDYKDAILKECEVVIAAVHSNFKMPKDKMTRRILAALKNKYVNLLSHPTGRLIGKRDPYEVDLEKIMKAAADTGTYLELNAHPERLDLNDAHCLRAKELKIKLSINTDAHSAGNLSDMKYGVATARRGWLEKKDVINTYPIDKLLKFLYAKR